VKDGNAVTARVVAAFEELGIEYFLAGSFSSNYYGIPRSTKDADFVAVLSGKIGMLESALGAEMELDPQTSFETVTGTMREILHLPSVPFEGEIFHLSNDEHGTRELLDEIRASIPPLD